jgi:hypothetical protein
MAPHPDTSQRLNTVIGYVTVAITTIKDLAQTSDMPFLKTISSTGSSLVDALQVLQIILLVSVSLCAF